LAPLRLEDEDATALRKIGIASAYLDILIHRRVWNFHAIDYSTMQYAMFLVMQEIRDTSVPELSTLLRNVWTTRLNPLPATTASASTA
jgi:hypothetical protein